MTDLDFRKIIMYIQKLTILWPTRGFSSVTKQLTIGIMTLVSGFGKETSDTKRNLIRFSELTLKIIYCEDLTQ